MSGKINASNLSAPSLQALRAERHQETKGSSFWNKWSNLSTGQKWGRALAWVIPPIGIGFQIKANLWQAKAAAPRPRESKVQRGQESIGGIPLRSNIVCGKAHRDLIKNEFARDLNKPLAKAIAPGDSKYSPAMGGLAQQFAADITRDANLDLQSHDGNASVKIDDKTNDKAQAFRGFFEQAFPDNPEKADQWAVFSSRFLHQHLTHGVMEANSAATSEGNVGKYFIPNDQAAFKLQMEESGDSALIEVRSQGKPNIWPGIDVENSRVDHFVLIRVFLGPPESLEVLSSHSKHSLVPENAEVENAAPVQPANSNEPISHEVGTSLLQQFANGQIPVGSDRDKNLVRYKQQLLNQDSLDLSAFEKAFTQLDEPGSQQKLIGELAGVIKDKERSQYIDLARESDERDTIMKRQILSDIRLEEDYPLSTRNAINPEKGPVVKNARDLDIQNFVNRKFEEEVAQKHLGVPADQFFTIIKDGMGPEAILTTGYLNKKDLPPALETLRSGLQQAFNSATTLDDFYSKASTLIENARQIADN